MSDELRLQRLPSDDRQEAMCFLCDDHFEPNGTLATLYHGRMPLGHICANCGAGKRQAAARVHKRAKRILALLNLGVEDGSDERSLRRMQLIHRHAGYWKTLATRIQKMDAWD
jgi:hypothetical protein